VFGKISSAAEAGRLATVVYYHESMSVYVTQERCRAEGWTTMY